jgi:protease I
MTHMTKITGTSPIARVQSFEAAPTVPRLSVPLMVTAEGELNAELSTFLTDGPADPDALRGRRIAIIATNGVEEVELTVPYAWAAERGAEVHLVSPKVNTGTNAFGVQMPEIALTHVLTVKFMENAGYFPIDRFLGDVEASDYDGLIVPGGAWNPDTLRADPLAQAFVRSAMEVGKPVFAICHGPLVLISAGLLSGRRATAFWAIHPDLANAGAEVVDEPCVVDGNLITGRFPYDLPRCLEAFGAQVAARAA